ncbi:MAG: TolC family protein [Pseudomonadota bacterium]
MSVGRLLPGLLAGWFATGLGATPLTLDQVLSHADHPHPVLDRARAETELARTEARLAESLDDVQVTLEAGLRSGRSTLSGQFEPDHFARLNARKPLWDGQRGAWARSAAERELAARESQLLDTRSQRRLTLMQLFFDILLADLRYAAESEFTAVAFVNWDNGRERQALGELSVVQLAELEGRFQEARKQRNAWLRQARELRARLAAAMNTPDSLPAELVEPRLALDRHRLPEAGQLLAWLESGNPRLRAQRDLLAAAEARLAARRADRNPSLDLELETAAYSREAYTRDELRAGLQLVWPLWQGERADAEIAREQARLARLRADTDQLALDLRQALIETREEIQFLIDSERPATRADQARRDWALDRAQAEYELELKTNLGHTMADTQIARLRTRSVEFRLALAWERLAALLGRPLEDFAKETLP